MSIKTETVTDETWETAQECMDKIVAQLESGVEAAKIYCLENQKDYGGFVAAVHHGCFWRDESSNRPEVVADFFTRLLQKGGRVSLILSCLADSRTEQGNSHIDALLAQIEQKNPDDGAYVWTDLPVEKGSIPVTERILSFSGIFVDKETVTNILLEALNKQHPQLIPLKPNLRQEGLGPAFFRTWAQLTDGQKNLLSNRLVELQNAHPPMPYEELAATYKVQTQLVSTPNGETPNPMPG